MRILFISNSTAISGAPAVLRNIVLGLKDRHEIAVVLPDSNGPLYAELISMGVKCYAEYSYGLTIWPRVINPIKYIKRLHGLCSDLPKLRAYIDKLIDEFKPDIVHTNVGPLDLALDACRRRSIPHVWHMREYQQGMTFWPTEKYFRKKIQSEGNWNIAITRSLFEYWGLRERDAVIYDSVERFAKAKLDLGCERKNFLFVGRIEKNKGLIELLKAYKIYRKNGGKQDLNIVGRSSSLYALKCRGYVKLRGLDSNVNFCGQRSDVRALMRFSSAVIICSKTEGFGLVAPEAMLEACPVIGKNTTGMKEQFQIGKEYTGGEIGLKYLSVRELADRLLFVDSHPDTIASMVARAELTLDKYYRPETMTEAIDTFYNKIKEESR